jgi:16S rRNA (guanine527-N7)-methyltransferase
MLVGMNPEELIIALQQEGIPVPDTALAQWGRHAALIREWNKVASLVSQGDARRLESTHLPDAVSLVPVVVRLGMAAGHLLDIGTGGGYPAIPMKVVLPDLRVTLVERSVKKIGFLRKVVAALGLRGVEIVHGDFPAAVLDAAADVVTARAVELPGKIQQDLAAWMPLGSVFLCQSGTPKAFPAEMFHVEHWEDDWSANGLRRGELYLVKRLG